MKYGIRCYDENQWIDMVNDKDIAIQIAEEHRITEGHVVEVIDLSMFFIKTIFCLPLKVFNILKLPSQ